MHLMDKSSWTRFKRGISHDFQQGVHQLSPAGARALQWLGEAGKRRLTRLRAISWHAFPLPLNVVLLLVATREYKPLCPRTSHSHAHIRALVHFW
jgi:hypothetical protein